MIAKDDELLVREWIDAARVATAARPVKLHVVPPWARRAIKKKLREEYGAAPDVVTWLLNDRRFGPVILFDHWGTSSIERYGYAGPSLVTEPYGHRSHIEAAFRFADWLGCEVEVGRASWWYPGSTIRIEFHPTMVTR